jgi:hypothetical protein
MIAHGIEAFSDSKAAVESLATIVGCSRKKHTSCHDISILTHLTLCVVLIWLFAVIINQRRAIAVASEGESGTWSPFVARLRAIRDQIALMLTASSIGPQHTTRAGHSLPHHSFEVSHITSGVVEPTQAAGREIILQ